MRMVVQRAVLALLVLWATDASAQTADEIVEQHLAATGGRAALAKLTSRVSTGSIALTTPVGEVKGTVDAYAKAPNKSRLLIVLDLAALGAGKATSDQRFDGSAGYVIDSFNGNREIAGEQLEAMRGVVFPTPLLNYRDLGTTLESLGREKTDTGDAYVLRLTPKSGPSVRMYIDGRTLMLVKTIVAVHVPEAGGEIEQTVEFSDYRTVDDVQVPYTIRSTNRIQTVTATMADVKHNVEIPDSSFARPAGQ